MSDSPIRVRINDIPLYCATTHSKAVLEGSEGVVAGQVQYGRDIAYNVLFEDDDNGVLVNPQLNAKMWTFFRNEFDIIEEKDDETISEN